jgi:hypothetical protein
MSQARRSVEQRGEMARRIGGRQERWRAERGFASAGSALSGDGSPSAEAAAAAHPPLNSRVGEIRR